MTFLPVPGLTRLPSPQPCCLLHVWLLATHAQMVHTTSQKKTKKLYLYDFPEHSQEEGCLQDTNMTDAGVSFYYERIKKFVKLQSNCNTCRVSQKGKNT